MRIKTVALQDVIVPDIGNYKDVPIIELHVKVGDPIKKEQSLITLETDKATMDVPAPFAGVVKAIKVKVGDKVSQGTLILQAEAVAIEAEAVAKAAAVEPVAASSATPQEIKVPDIGNYKDVPVIEVAIKVGDKVTKEQSLITLETDKATMEIPSPMAGVITEVRVTTSSKVSQGSVLALIQAETSASDKAEKAPATNTSALQASTTVAAVQADTENSNYVHAGPAVRQLARELGLDLTAITGSGPKNRIMREDITQLVKKTLQNAGAKGAVSFDLPLDPQVDFAQFGAIKTQPLPRIKKLSGGFLARNWVRVPHITLFDEADITDLETFRNAKKAAAEKSGAKLTPLPFLLKAVAAALKKYPLVNSSLSFDGQSLVFKEYIHIGVAVDTPDGLMVPVIRNVDQKGVLELAKELGAVSLRAREGKLSGADMQGGTFTISSLGGIGTTAFTPIVNMPEVGILGVSKAETKPKWDGHAFQPRLMLPLSLSLDHRVVDGAEGARFLSFLVQVLQDLKEILL